MQGRAALVATSLVAVCGLAALPAAQGADERGDKRAGKAARKASVKVVDFKFKPGRVKIRDGGKVKWRFEEGRHNVTGKGWKSPTKTSGTYKHKFKRKGTYKYHCTLHAGMDGKVRVVK